MFAKYYTKLLALLQLNKGFPPRSVSFYQEYGWINTSIHSRNILRNIVDVIYLWQKLSSLIYEYILQITLIQSALIGMSISWLKVLFDILQTNSGLVVFLHCSVVI